MIGQGWDENLKFSSLSLFPQIDQNSKNEFLQVKKIITYTFTRQLILKTYFQTVLQIGKFYLKAKYKTVSLLMWTVNQKRTC